ncbi:signal peptidase I [Halosegnis marinus]|uniref:Signal peptidase I n=1 Tax=Halosegnis marinus TaxID=3034023 RepID=A0ABD5ZQL8_9EURY|nr:signal peptidase I [Halosegnis sp. DT85]
MKRGLVRGGELLVVCFVLAMVAGQLLGQPVLLSYVTTGSMSPTLDPGEGFVAVPSAVADVEEGDVVTFRAEELNGGGLTTHRVVGETERGYVTKGDANPFTDQDGDEPPVKESQIVAVAWQPGGQVLAVPFVGTLVEGSRMALAGTQRRLAAALGTRSLLGTTGLAYLVFALSVVWYLVEAYRDRGAGRERTRDRSRDDGFDPRVVVALLALVVVASATAAMVVPAGAQKYGVVSAESDAPGPRVIETGTEETVTYPVGNGGVIPVVSFLEPGSEGVAVEPGEVSVGPRAVRNATVTLSAPPETGYYRRFVVEHRYLALLPRSHIRALYGVHPWLPLVAIDALLAGSFYAVGTAMVGSGRVRSRKREGRNTGLLGGILP